MEVSRKTNWSKNYTPQSFQRLQVHVYMLTLISIQLNQFVLLKSEVGQLCDFKIFQVVSAWFMACKISKFSILLA